MMLSQITLGCMQFTGETPEEVAIQTVERAVELGINHLETARGYGNSEERVGKALKRIFKKIPREQLYITTKIGPDSDLDKFKRNWDTCMSLLGLDYLDNLDFHGPGSPEQIRAALSDRGCLGFVRKLQSEGTLRHFGFSTHGYPKGVMDLVNTQEFDSINLHYYYFYQGLRKVVDRAAELDMGVFIISPSNQGGRLHKPTLELEAACKPLHPVTFNQMWLLNQPEVGTLSSGPANPAQIDRNLLVADYDGTGPQREAFDRVMANVERTYRAELGDTLCTVCNECLPCPENINIPGLLNWRNVAVGFNMIDYAQGRYKRVGGGGAWVPGVKGDQCTKCGDCLPRCPEELHIPELLWDAHQRLETGEITPPRWQHEGDLLDTDLKQT
ncbi:MAG: aldo/keto reductase [Candidatus Poribacteria bacterium]|nr:aldo/keto reductase [Candidatus Poribacteria bacterium]